MEMTISRAAEVAGVTTRRLQQAAETGDLSVQRVAGRTLLIDSAVLAAYLRTSRSGRRWGHRTARAALELLNDGRTTLLSGSELSRLRSRLSVLSGAGIAHKLNAAAGWFRYRSVGEASAETLAGVRLTGPSALTDERLAEQLSLLPGPASSVFGVVDDLSMAEVELALVPDGEGDIFLAERASAGGTAQILVDIFLFGDARESAAAELELERRGAAC